HFPDCEVVYYYASTASRSVRCVEFEATRKDSMRDAIATVERFERATGFDGVSRSRLSLPQMLFPDLAETLAGQPRQESGRPDPVRVDNATGGRE
ncbi:MAG: hypothetical protein OEW19_03370, partial [Acidobacteriota bacterium]|nr:hypothetical protein [Acidobacteriota bacterium]